jgi:hypothetical protein
VGLTNPARSTSPEPHSFIEREYRRNWSLRSGSAMRENVPVPLKRVKYEDDESSFRIEGGGEIGFDHDGALVMPLEAVADVGLAYFVKALDRCMDFYGTYIEGIYVSDEPAAGFDRDRSQVDVSLNYDKGVLSTAAVFPVDSTVPSGRRSVRSWLPCSPSTEHGGWTVGSMTIRAALRST